MVTLHLGVLDVAYSDASGNGATTTGQVAEIIEKNYGVMETFYELHKEKITELLTNAMAESLEMLIKSGQRIDTSARGGTASQVIRGVTRTASAGQSGTLTYGADQKIEADFRTFLDAGEMNRIMGAFTGSPISAAAQAGQSKRFKSGYTPQRKPRPAFVDTGLYRASMRAWTTDDL